MMDMAPWPQETGLGAINPTMADLISPSSCLSKPLLEKKARPQKEQALNCPRCNSTNTKFCYYNNYSLSQPRYFCKTCRRYWTEGGSLRNVPVGGGSRKNKRSISKRLADHTAASFLNSSHPLNTQDGKDLNLTFPTPQDYKSLASSDAVDYENLSSSSLSTMDLMRNNLSTRSMSPFLSTNNQLYGASPLGLNDFRSPSADGFTGFGNLQGISENGRLGFTLEDPRQASLVGSIPGEASGYWNGAFAVAPWTHVPNYGP